MRDGEVWGAGTSPGPVTIASKAGGTVSVAIDPKLRRVLVTGRNHIAEVWDLDTQREVSRLPIVSDLLNGTFVGGLPVVVQAKGPAARRCRSSRSSRQGAPTCSGWPISSCCYHCRRTHWTLASAHRASGPSRSRAGRSKSGNYRGEEFSVPSTPHRRAWSCFRRTARIWRSRRRTVCRSSQSPAGRRRSGKSPSRETPWPRRAHRRRVRRRRAHRRLGRRLPRPVR